jgi:hypothetical protein
VDQVSRQFRQPIQPAIRKPVVDRKVLPSERCPLYPDKQTSPSGASELPFRQPGANEVVHPNRNPDHGRPIL